MALYEQGLVGVPGTPELIGANAEAISTAEDRDKFKQAMIEIGLSVPKSGVAHNMEESIAVLEEIGLPVIIRPAYILGGRGTGIANTMEEFLKIVADGLDASPIREILIETSIVGWKEYELEVMRDKADNCVIICSIENFDPMGVHTGDSITVAPAQTLSDVEYQKRLLNSMQQIKSVDNADKLEMIEDEDSDKNRNQKFENDMLAQVIGIILGSPEFQRR
jgi:carbamoyl-phosphate synthase large subunit